MLISIDHYAHAELVNSDGDSETQPPDCRAPPELEAKSCIYSTLIQLFTNINLFRTFWNFLLKTNSKFKTTPKEKN